MPGFLRIPVIQTQAYDRTRFMQSLRCAARLHEKSCTAAWFLRNDSRVTHAATEEHLVPEATERQLQAP
jgi:hypothetical protein